MSLLCSKPQMTFSTPTVTVLIMASGPRAVCSLPPLPFTHSAPATPSFRCSRMPPGTSPPQGSGLGGSVSWEYSSPRKPHGQLPHLPWSFLKFHGSVKPLCPSLSPQALLSCSSAWSTAPITAFTCLCLLLLSVSLCPHINTAGTDKHLLNE